MKLSSADLFHRIIGDTPFSEEELALLILTAPTRYKDHFIEKRNGRGRRLISQPTSELKLIQRWLVKTELSKLQLDVHATAYRKGSSIREHVEQHAKSHFLLKLDFKDFFPSLTDSALRHRLALDASYSDLEIFIFCQLLFRKPRSEQVFRLSIGAPSSPFMSNYLLIEFDKRLADYCQSSHMKYTRYADDIAISANRAGALDSALAYVEELITDLSYLGLTINRQKTVNVSKKFRRELVGLVISTQGQVSLGREEKRRLRAAVHALSLNKLSIEDVSKLRGQLAFSLSIEPKFVMQLCARHGISRPSDIMPPM